MGASWATCGVASLDVDKMGWSGILDMDKDLELLKKDFKGL